MFFSHFTAHFAANRNRIPAGVAAVIRREALQRVQDRQAAGRAGSALDFSDLIERIEQAVAGGSAIA